jgi:hypothetical protein
MGQNQGAAERLWWWLSFPPFFVLTYFCCYYCFIAGSGSGLDDVCMDLRGLSVKDLPICWLNFAHPFNFSCVLFAWQVRKERVWRNFGGSSSQILHNGGIIGQRR